MLITELQAEPDYAYVKKLFGGGTQVEFVTVGGDRGFWISGPVHELVVIGPGGTDHTDGSPDALGRALAWRLGAWPARAAAAEALRDPDGAFLASEDALA